MNYLAAPFPIRDSFPPAALFANVGELATAIIQILIAAAGAIGFIFIVIAGIKYVTASGDPKKIASASSALLYAIIGIAVAILAFVIVRVLQFFLKSDIPIT